MRRVTDGCGRLHTEARSEPSPGVPGGDAHRQGFAAAITFVLLLALGLGMSVVRAQSPASEALAEVNGEAITVKDVEKPIAAKLSSLEEQIYNLKRTELDALIAQRLLAQEAAKRGVSVAALVDAEVTSKVALVTEKEIDDYYQANKAQLRGDEASLRAEIRTVLQQQKLTMRRELFVASLRSQSKVVVRLGPPAASRVEVSIAGAPLRGAADATVTLVEFSDFECPFCKKASTTVAKLLEKYPGKIRLAYRDFPLESIHPQARRAAEAARCAQAGGKFWEYHDLLFARSPKLAPDDLKRYAREVGLDSAKFDACLTSSSESAGVQKDIDEGQRLGITGTPVFFVNGRAVRGAQPIEAFTRIIDDELARTASVAAKTQ